VKIEEPFCVRRNQGAVALSHTRLLPRAEKLRKTADKNPQGLRRSWLAVMFSRIPGAFNALFLGKGLCGHGSDQQ